MTEFFRRRTEGEFISLIPSVFRLNTHFVVIGYDRWKKFVKQNLGFNEISHLEVSRELVETNKDAMLFS